MAMQAKFRKDYKSPDFTVTDIKLAFNLEKTTETIVSNVMNVKRLRDGAQSVVLNGIDLELISLKVNGKTWEAYQLDEEYLTVHVGTELNDFTIEVVNSCSPATNTTLQGLYQSGNTLCTQCEAEGFRQITFMMDRPDVLARYTVTITGDKNKYPYMLANGNRKSSLDLMDGMHQVVWEDPMPKPSYLFALVAGDFDVLEDHYVVASGRDVKLELYVDKGSLDRASHAMHSLKKSMAWDERRFGLEYDLDLYMIVAVDFFNMGAMENKGLNVFNSVYVLANEKTATDAEYLDVERVIGHEYFHNWTGDRVTCRDWFQLSLKEGLTVFREQEFCSDENSRVINRINEAKLIRTAQFAEDAGPMSHPIRPDKVIEMDNFYTLTVYEKGSEVIRMIHTLLGEAAFQQGMKLYFARFDGKAATCDDFVSAMEDASKVDLTQFRKWYSQSGTPIVTVEEKYDQAQQVYTLVVRQHTLPTLNQAEKEALHIPLKLSLYTADGKKLPLEHNVLNVTEAYQEFNFPGVTEQPVPALLEDFSAPVKLEYAYTTEQLLFLAKYADNAFVRWDALQRLYLAETKANLVRYQNKEELQFSIDLLTVLQGIAKDYQGDLEHTELTTMLLTPPSALELCEYFDVIDPVGVSQVRKFLVHSVAHGLENTFLDIYNTLKLDVYTIDRQDIAKRSLRNLALSYLATLGTQAHLVAEHYNSANNMTDVLAAMSCATANNLASADSMLADFEAKWKHDGLVMDKWFRLQALMSDEHAIERVQHLMQHESFNFDNPNRLRALIGAFVNGNLLAFHATDGSGYRFATDIISKIDSKNPHLSAGLVVPFLKLNRYSQERKLMIRSHLEELAKLPNISKNLFEKVQAGLEMSK